MFRLSLLCTAALAVSWLSALADEPGKAARGADLSCESLPNTGDLLREQNQTFLIFGEIHGSREAPKAFGETVCEAARTGPVVVGIERPSQLSGVMQNFVDSDGSDDARFTLLRGFFDGTDWGLSSQAFLDLFIRLQQLTAQGADIRMVGFTSATTVGSGSQTPYERRLAAELLRASARNPDARILVLVGNLHARKETYPELGSRPAFDPMVMPLPQDEVLSFNIAHSGGDTHRCTAEGCGPQPVDGRADPEKTGIWLSDGDLRYDGIWNIGPVSASPPIGTRY
ncbi:MAG: hypothetical protein CME84_05000 [Henriciella sp.]|nr:hypothetical protein [Henriciella sp.]